MGKCNLNFNFSQRCVYAMRLACLLHCQWVMNQNLSFTIPPAGTTRIRSASGIICHYRDNILDRAPLRLLLQKPLVLLVCMIYKWEQWGGWLHSRDQQEHPSAGRCWGGSLRGSLRGSVFVGCFVASPCSLLRKRMATLLTFHSPLLIEWNIAH